MGDWRGVCVSECWSLGRVVVGGNGVAVAVSSRVDEFACCVHSQAVVRVLLTCRSGCLVAHCPGGPGGPDEVGGILS